MPDIVDRRGRRRKEEAPPSPARMQAPCYYKSTIVVLVGLTKISQYFITGYYKNNMRPFARTHFPDVGSFSFIFDTTTTTSNYCSKFQSRDSQSQIIRHENCSLYVHLSGIHVGVSIQPFKFPCDFHYYYTYNSRCKEIKN